MASLSQPQFFSSLVPIKKISFTLSPQYKSFHTIKTSKILSSNAESSPNSQENQAESQQLEKDPVKLALAKAKAYKKSVKSGVPSPEIVRVPPEISGNNEGFQRFDEIGDGDAEKDIPLAVKIAKKKAEEYKRSKILAENEAVASKIVGNNEGFQRFDEIGDGDAEKNVSLAVKIAKKKAEEYKKSKIIVESEGVASKIAGSSDDEDGGEGKGKEIPLSVKLALDKAKEYKKNISLDNGGVGASEKSTSGNKGGSERMSADKQANKKSGKKEEFSISSIDFMGLGFADKKSGRGLPAGLVPFSDTFTEGKMPEVEFLVGDATNFGEKSAAPVEEDDEDLYKPKVSTWGVFPRPNNISKAFGGGRTLRPGQALETAEEKAAKDARTRQLLAAYKKQTGLDIDPKIKSECEKVLSDGDTLMDRGKLKEASPFYENVMEKMPFKSELHGLAALQWSICQDSLNRTNEARVMYEKLLSHPSPKVSKKARQFIFGFQAMEMMKVNKMNRYSLSSDYQNFFNAFVQQKTNYTSKESEEVDEGGLNQTLPYFLFLASPILMVLLIAVFR